MNILYYGIASKFTHSMPAGWFLCEYLASKGIETQEVYRNINESYPSLLQDIIDRKPDILLLSVYVFNVNVVTKLIKDIRLQLDCKIVIGGPEADEYLGADYVIFGEGELALYNYIIGKENDIQLIEPLDNIRSPYTDARLASAKNKLIYYESSRGCPFSCTYCTAPSSKVRYFSLPRVKQDLINIVNSGVRTIKFTDRTFNLHPKRANEILCFIKDNFSANNTTFHFEIMGDILTPDTLEILHSMPKGLVQLEIGVQSLNSNSLKAVARKLDLKKLEANILPIIRAGNIHIHLDMIAGLPHETLATFTLGFDTLFAFRPQVLQLGFLKVLKGTPIKDKFIGALYSPVAPYEIVSTPTMSSQDLEYLKNAEFALDKLYNSGAFLCSLEYLLTSSNSACAMFATIGKYFQEKGINTCSQRPEFFNALLDFASPCKERLKELLRLDFLCSDAGRKIPRPLRGSRCKAFYDYLDAHQTTNCFYEQFAYIPNNAKQGNYILQFDYSYKDPVSKRYSYKLVKTL